MALVVRNLPANADDLRCGFDPWVRKIPWRKAWQPTPVFLPGESHGQRRQATVHRVTQSWTRLKWLSTHAGTATIRKENPLLHELTPPCLYQIQLQTKEELEESKERK